MDSITRVNEALALRCPDRAPLGFFAIDSDTAGKVLGRETYWRAKAKSQIAIWQGRRDEVVHSWINDGIELYKKLDIIDIVPACCICPPRGHQEECPKQLDESTWAFKDGRVMKYSPMTQDLTLVEDPGVWQHSYSLDDELWDGVVHEPDESIFEVIDALIDAFGQDRYLLGPSAGEYAWLLLGNMERGLMEMAMRPDEVREIFNSKVEQANALDAYYIRPGQHAVLWGTDLASQNGPLMNPKQYREMFLPGFAKRSAAVKQRGQKVVKHACGNNWPLLDCFVDAGIDCYQSIQESAGMDLPKLQKEYGDKFALWGGVPVEMLIQGTPSEVQARVEYLMKEIAPAGGYIMGTTHSVAVGSRYENFMALMETYSRYC